MTTPTHLAFGLVIGAWLGHMPAALVASVVVDADHLTTYARHGVLTNPKLFWETTTDNEDPYGGQRGIFHSLFLATPICALLIGWGGGLGLVIAAAYGSHLLLDLLDSADYWPFYPFKKINIRGPVRFFSKGEAVVSSVLLALALLKIL